jgi:hypothetical protein
MLRECGVKLQSGGRGVYKMAGDCLSSEFSLAMRRFVMHKTPHHQALSCPELQFGDGA